MEKVCPRVSTYSRTPPPSPRGSTSLDIVEEKPSDVELDIESEEDGLADFKL